MSYAVIVTPEARDQLNAIYDYIADVASPEISRRFTDSIVDHLTILADHPRIGSPRDDEASSGNMRGPSILTPSAENMR